MLKNVRNFVIALGACTVSAPTFAAPVYGVFNIGLDFGGDKIIEVTLSDGSTDDIAAGEGVYFAAGIGTGSADGKYDGQLTIGYKTTSISASNGEVDWTHFPIEALAYMNHNKVRLGGGMTYVVNSKLKGGGVLSFIDADIDNALGFLLEGQYRFSDQLLAGARATFIDYEANGVAASGNSFGIDMTFQFAK